MMDYFADLVRVNLLAKQLHTDRDWGQWSDDGMCQILDHVGKHQQFNCHLGLANGGGRNQQIQHPSGQLLEGQHWYPIR